VWGKGKGWNLRPEGGGNGRAETIETNYAITFAVVCPRVKAVADDPRALGAL
jgi:hypothetical protein